jgi:hypothetical protein
MKRIKTLCIAVGVVVSTTAEAALPEFNSVICISKSAAN